LFRYDRLGCCIFIDAEHRGKGWLIPTRPNIFRGLPFKAWIVRGRVALDPMRLQPLLAPVSGHIMSLRFKRMFLRTLWSLRIDCVAAFGLFGSPH
jgi:hypothetical protein